MSHLFTAHRDSAANRCRATTYTYDDSSGEGIEVYDTEQSSGTGRPATDPSTYGFQAQARITREQYFPSNKIEPPVDREVPTTPLPNNERELKICCCTVTLRQLRRCTRFFAYFVILILGLLLGGVIWHVIRSKRDDREEFFGSPWIWPETNMTVGAYYYPWYSHDFHRGSGYLREKLSTVQKPVLGEYDDTDPATIYQHLKWSAQANIGLWVTSWWGPGTREDTTTKDVILEHPALGNHRIALFYETTGRIKEDDGYSTHRVIPDIEYLTQQYFGHPNYYRIDGRPVLFVYLTRKLEGLGLLDDVVEQMRLAAGNGGYNIFIAGDHVFHSAPNKDEIKPTFTVLDAITNYDVYGNMFQPSPYATEARVLEHYQRAREWKALAAKYKCAFIPSVAPGYNDLGVRPEKQHGPLSRKLSADDVEGSLFTTSLRYARKLLDPTLGNVLMVNSFNEWHEDTQIEPCTGKSTTLPESLTQGVEYIGYEEHYLNILREETRL